MKITSSRISQFIFLAIFIILFVNTEYRGRDEISVAINSFFRANPLVTISYILAVKAMTILLIPGIMMILASAILGRFFCGWICPLGTIIDLATGWIRRSAPVKFLKGRLKYYILFTLLATALFNVNIAGVFDPIAILVRAFTFFLYPLFGYTMRSGWAGLYAALGEKRDHLDPLFSFLQNYVLPFRETFYPLAFLSLIFFIGILFLERYEKRNWCKNLCPLGTLLGIMGNLSIFRRIPGKLCADCGKCREICPTGFDTDTLQKSDCILCMDCKLQCAFKRVKFPLKGIPSAKQEKAGGAKPVLGRRVFMGSVLSGFFLSRVFAFQPPGQHERLLRPPGVNNEKDFLKKCVRCGECIKVCLRSALYPDYFKAGLYGVFMPVIIPRLGYCEYNCNLCGQVCPTGAIPNLTLEKKKKSVIGVASFDKDHCLPYARKINCIVCEEHCPIPEKAIRFEVVEEKDHSGRTVTLKKPYIVEELCTGCGICENKCPLEGKSAIEVFTHRKRLVNA